MRKARQPLERLDGDASGSVPIKRQTMPVEPVDEFEDTLDFAAITDIDLMNTPVELPTHTAPRHDIRHPIAPSKPPSVPSEVIVVSSDTEDDGSGSTTAMHGSTDTKLRPPRPASTRESAEAPSRRALQLLLERDQGFYESLEHDLAQQQVQRYASEASSSSATRMESMVPDASTSYDTSSWAAPTRTTYSYESYPIDRLQAQAVSGPSSFPHRAYYGSPRAPTPMNTSLLYDAYGNPVQPVYLAPPQTHPSNAYLGYMLAPVMSENDARDARSPFGSDYRPDSRHNPRSHQSPVYEPAYYPQHQQDWHGSVPLAPLARRQQQEGYDRASLAAYARPKTPRRAHEDKAKADLVYKALQGVSKRGRTKSSGQVGPSLSKGKGKDNEWSTLKPLRAGSDGSLSLTAALRRPLPATKLAHGIRGGNRLALPLYRNLGSSPEERRRAETALSRDSFRPDFAEGSTSSRSRRTADASHPPKLFRPTPLTKTERKGQSE